MLVPHSAFPLLVGCFPFSQCSCLKVKKEQSNQGATSCFTFSHVLSFSLPTAHKNPPAAFHLLTIETTYRPSSCICMRGVWVFCKQKKNPTYDNSKKAPRCWDKTDPCSQCSVAQTHNKIYRRSCPAIVKTNFIPEILVLEGKFRAFVQATASKRGLSNRNH